MNKTQFVYVAYIATTPEKLWHALLDPDMVKLWWCRHRNVSDWKSGSAWQHQDYDNPATIDIAGTVIESQPPRRLAFTWAFPAEANDPAKVSRVTFVIEPFSDACRLTLTHNELEPGSFMQEGVSKGWPIMLSSLKSLLETGKALTWTTVRCEAPPE